MTQSFKTGRAKILGLANVDSTADFQGLIAQAMPILQQQQRVSFQILHLDGRFGAERMIDRQGNREVLLIELARLDAVLPGGQRHQPKIDFAVP